MYIVLLFFQPCIINDIDMCAHANCELIVSNALLLSTNWERETVLHYAVEHIDIVIKVPHY